MRLSEKPGSGAVPALLSPPPLAALWGSPSGLVLAAIFAPISLRFCRQIQARHHPWKLRATVCSSLYKQACTEPPTRRPSSRLNRRRSSHRHGETRSGRRVHRRDLPAWSPAAREERSARGRPQFVDDRVSWRTRFAAWGASRVLHWPELPSGSWFEALVRPRAEHKPFRPRTLKTWRPGEALAADSRPGIRLGSRKTEKVKRKSRYLGNVCNYQ